MHIHRVFIARDSVCSLWRPRGICGGIRTVFFSKYLRFPCHLPIHQCSLFIYHGSPNFLWHSAKPVIVVWFARRSWKITIVGTPDCLNCCEIFVIYTLFTNVAVGRINQPGGPQVGDPWSIPGERQRAHQRLHFRGDASSPHPKGIQRVTDQCPTRCWCCHRVFCLRDGHKLWRKQDVSRKLFLLECDAVWFGRSVSHPAPRYVPK